MRLRAPVPADAPAVATVLAARDVADIGAPTYSLEDLRDEWRSSDLDLAHSARVVEDAEGRIVAYARVRRHGTFAVVAPEYEGQGIGSRLLEWAERRECEDGHPLHRQWVTGSNASARALLTSAGYARARSYWRLSRTLGADDLGLERPGDPPLRGVDPERDGPALHRLDAASFAGAPDYEPESLGEFCHEHLEAHDFDPELSRVAERDGRIIGFLLARRREDEGAGYVDVLAVDPEHQRRGVGTALLRSAFSAFAAAGLREAQLNVASDNPRAVRVYERLGMTERERSDIYERPTTASASRWRSYHDVDAADDPRALAEELEEIATVPFVAAEKRRSLELLELERGASVLDVGCGTGAELASLAEMVGPAGRAVGLERSAALIGQARNRAAARRPASRGEIELVQGDAGALPFAEGEFDACRADRTLQHLARPAEALREMVRVIRAGGRLVITESRWGLVAPGLEQELTDRVLGLVATASEQADWVGYRLPAMFEQAGLSEVRSLSSDYTASEVDEFFRFTRLRSAADHAVQAGRLSREQAAAWLSRLEHAVRVGEAFAMVLILHVAGAKPPV